VAGVLSECALLLLALAGGRLLGVRPLGDLRIDAAAVAYGFAATIPMLALLYWCLHTGWVPIRRLVGLVEDHLRPYLAGASASGIILLSFMAGLGEEALFRGLIQTAIAERLPAWTAIALAALLFGAAHGLTLSYALLAGLIGVYLGGVFLLTGNLLIPIVAHGVYDVVALSALARAHRRKG
jgi:membrane protease YdiL (CAAX protease family)